MSEQVCREPECRRPVLARGLCGRCYQRHRRNGMPAIHPSNRTSWTPTSPPEPITPTFGTEHLPQRIWSSLQVTESGCWEWTGQRLPSGYGVVFAARRTWYIHRLVYTVFTGAIPDGHDMDHYLWPDDGCIGPACALHTRPASRRENVLRGGGFAAWNLAKTHCPRGHAYAGDNLYLNKQGYRDCKECRRARKRKDWRAA